LRSGWSCSRGPAQAPPRSARPLRIMWRWSRTHVGPPSSMPGLARPPPRCRARFALLLDGRWRGIADRVPAMRAAESGRARLRAVSAAGRSDDRPGAGSDSPTASSALLAEAVIDVGGLSESVLLRHCGTQILRSVHLAVEPEARLAVLAELRGPLESDQEGACVRDPTTVPFRFTALAASSNPSRTPSRSGGPRHPPRSPRRRHALPTIVPRSSLRRGWRAPPRTRAAR
jgi:hypothetical protein